MDNKCIYLYRYICVGSDGVHNKFCLCFWSYKIVLFVLSFSVINRNGEIYILAVDFVKKKSLKSCKIRFYCKYPHVWPHKVTQDQVIEDSSYKTTTRSYRSFFCRQYKTIDTGTILIRDRLFKCPFMIKRLVCADNLLAARSTMFIMCSSLTANVPLVLH
jgi:hypothetical protein